MTVRKYTRSRDGKATTTILVDVKWRHPDGRVERIKQRSPIQTMRGAAKYEQQIRQSLADGTWGRFERDDVPTLSEFWPEYRDGHVKVHRKPSGIAGVQAIFRDHLLPFFGDMPLDKIGSQELARFTGQKVRAKLNPKTVNNILSALRKTLITAATWKVIEALPPFLWLKVPDSSFDFLSFEEAPRLVEGAAGDQPWQAMIAFALTTGLRLGELRALQWPQVDLERLWLDVERAAWRNIEGTPKGGRSRGMPLPPVVVPILESIRRERGYVFTANGQRLTKEQCKWPLWRAADRAVLGRRFGWHVLRHTFASHLVMKGAPLKTVQELLGHRNIQMTMRYAHLSADARRDAVGLLDLKAPRLLPSE